METTPVAQSRLIGAILVESGLITDDQLERALELQDETGERLGEVLIAHFGVSRTELASVLAEQWAVVREGNPIAFPPAADTAREDAENGAATPTQARDAAARPRRPLGEIFVERGLITNEQLDHALTTQWEQGGRIGDILVAQGAIRRIDLADALAEQWSLLQVLRGPSTDGTPMPVPTGTTAADLWAAFERALDDVDERIRTVEESAIAAPVGPFDDLVAGVREEVAAASSRIDALAGRLETADERDEARDRELKLLQEEVARLQERPEHAEQITDLAERVAGLATHRAELEEQIERLGRRLDEQGEATVGPARLDELRQSLEQRIDATSDRTTEAHGRMDTSFDEVHRLLGDLTRRVDDLGGLDASLAALRETVVGIEAAAAAAAEERSGAVTALEGLSERLRGLEARVQPASDDGLGERIETAQAALESRVSALDEAVQALARRSDDDSRLAEVVHRLERSEEAVTRLEAQRPEDVAVAGLIETVAELRAERSTLVASLGELRELLRAGTEAQRDLAGAVERHARDASALREVVDELEARESARSLAEAEAVIEVDDDAPTKRGKREKRERDEIRKAAGGKKRKAGRKANHKAKRKSKRDS